MPRTAKAALIVAVVLAAGWSLAEPARAARVGGVSSNEEGGVVWAWGNNSWGALGDGTYTYRETPVRVFGLDNVSRVAAGEYSSYALGANGLIWAWGSNYTGQLGDGTLLDSNVPVQVLFDNPAVAIAAGRRHALAAYFWWGWTWGSNIQGQLGDGTYSNRSAPVDVWIGGGFPPITVRDVAGGQAHSLASRSDGLVYAWGEGIHGQLGDGEQSGSNTPVRVRSLSAVTAIAAGGWHSLALRGDGSVWAWGYNGWGQLGDGTTTTRNVPTRVDGLPPIQAIAAGYGHSLAVATDGSVWAWGLNDSYQLGDGTGENRKTPVRVTGIGQVSKVAGGWKHSLALHSDGTVWGWGVAGGSVSAIPVRTHALAQALNIAAGRDVSLVVADRETAERRVEIPSVEGSPGTFVDMPVILHALGGENALAFTLNFDPSRLSAPLVSLGEVPDGTSLALNETELDQGRLGVSIALPAGQGLPAGPNSPVEVQFFIEPGTTEDASVELDDRPVIRQIAGLDAKPLGATWTAGMVRVATRYEADVAPRPTGDSTVGVDDWVQVGRFAAVLDDIGSSSELQRADCAPIETKGDGQISVADWVQAGRYAAGLDPLTEAGGPAELGGRSGARATGSALGGPTVRVEGSSTLRGQSLSLPVILDGDGEENAIGFTVSFDPELLSFDTAVVGADAAGAQLVINSDQAEAGLVGVLLALPSGERFGAGPQEILSLTFSTSAGPETTTTVGLGSEVVAAEVTDELAGALGVTWEAGEVMLHGCPGVELAPYPFARATSTTSIMIEWTAVPGALGYRVFRDQESYPVYEGPDLVYTDEGLRPRSRHCYQVQGFNACAGGPLSGISCDRTPGDGEVIPQ